MVVTCAVDGDFRCAMEALTWIEELEQVLDEQVLLDALLAVRGAVEDTPKDDPRSALYASMLQHCSDWNALSNSRLNTLVLGRYRSVVGRADSRADPVAGVFWIDDGIHPGRAAA